MAGLSLPCPQTQPPTASRAGHTQMKEVAGVPSWLPSSAYGQLSCPARKPKFPGCSTLALSPSSFLETGACLQRQL